MPLMDLFSITLDKLRIFFSVWRGKKQNNYKRFKDKKAELFFFLVRDIKLKVYICNVVCLFSSKNATNQKDGGKTGGRCDWNMEEIKEKKEKKVKYLIEMILNITR